jgi:hypothetical protein
LNSRNISKKKRIQEQHIFLAWAKHHLTASGISEQNWNVSFYLRANACFALVQCGVAQLHACSETRNLNVL